VPRLLVIVEPLPWVHGWKLLCRTMRENHCGRSARPNLPDILRQISRNRHKPYQ
jgi:hypothetical protein